LVQVKAATISGRTLIFSPKEGCLKRFYSPISIPNILTLVRILLTPLFVIFLIRNQFPQALLIFAIAGVTDGLDGFIARCLDQRTALGAFLDPIADKLLLVSSYVALAVLEVIPAWVAVVVIARDVIIVLGIAVLTLTEKKYKVKPTIISKCTTTVQIGTILINLFDPYHAKLSFLHPCALWLTALLTIFSGLHYTFLGMRILQEPNARKMDCEER
jgi:cardiolipin synthase